MSSPSKKFASAIDVRSQKALKSDEHEYSGTVESNGALARKVIRQVKLNDSDESPAQSQSSNESLGTAAAVGRSGRVRKAKVVFDPSDMELASKRKSWTATESEVKPKKVPRTSDVKKEVPAPQQPSPETAKKIDQRRKTAGNSVQVVPADDENGCIVCTRSDVKKGRFVVCINCPTRGHFTCLRNAKYLTSAPEEKHWQCDKCLRCAQCNDTKKSGNLFKCTLCFLSFHLNCMQARSGAVTKKKFKCDDCLGVDHDDDENDGIVDEVVEVNKSDEAITTKKTPGNGFAGFSQEETTKSSASSRSSSSGCSSDIRAEKSHTQQSNPEQRRKLSLSKPVGTALHRSASSSKSASFGGRSTSLFDMADIKSDLTNLKIEPEDRSPTPDREPTAHSIAAPNKSKSIYNTDESDANEVEKCVDIQYDRRTQLRPHESIPDVKKWDCDEVYTYFLGTTTAEYAHLFREHQIDGDALLLIKREDVLNRFNLKLGPALRLYSHIVALQFKNNNPILAWDED